MAVPTIPPDQMRAALKELQQALYNHEQWGETLFGTLICHLSPDQRDIDEDAHRHCRFGQCVGSARKHEPGMKAAAAKMTKLAR